MASQRQVASEPDHHCIRPENSIWEGGGVFLHGCDGDLVLGDRQAVSLQDLARLT